MTGNPQTAAIVVAAGRGERLGGSVAKPFLPLGGRPILMHAVQAVQACPLVHHIVVVVAQTHVAETHQLVPYQLDSPRLTVESK